MRKIKNNTQEGGVETSIEECRYFMSEVTHLEMTLPIDGEIKTSSYYTQALHQISKLTEDDSLIVKVDTPGGCLRSTINIVNAIKTTKAMVTCELIGEASSGGSLITLACNDIILYPYSEMMLHRSAGSVGYGSTKDLVERASFQSKEAERFLRDIYLAFLSPEELQSLFDGKEFWFDSSEIARRLDLRKAYFEGFSANSTGLPDTLDYADDTE